MGNTGINRKWLQQKMEAVGIKSASDLGRKIGIESRSSMSHLIKGTRTMQEDTLIAMSKVLNVSIRELTSQFGGKNLDFLRAVDADEKQYLNIKGIIDDRFSVNFYPNTRKNETVKLDVKTATGAFALRYETANTGASMFNGFVAVILAKRELDPSSMIGRTNLVWLDNGQILLRRVSPGQLENHYNLDAAHTLPLYDQKLIAFAPVQILVCDPSL